MSIDGMRYKIKHVATYETVYWLLNHNILYIKLKSSTFLQFSKTF
jgi:hypothetical protein